LVFEDVNNNGLWDTGEALLQQRARLHASVSATGNATVARYVSFGPSGRSLTLNGAFQAGTITLCARGASGEDAWLLVVNAVGRSRLDKGQMAICP
jgi:type IV fimbrial biogenesis protein FimT